MPYRKQRVNIDKNALLTNKFTDDKICVCSQEDSKNLEEGMPEKEEKMSSLTLVIDLCQNSKP